MDAELDALHASASKVRELVEPLIPEHMPMLQGDAGALDRLRAVFPGP